MNNLEDININFSYRTGRDDLGANFYEPCLSESILYRRAVGYFSSSSLSLLARGIAKLRNNKGKIKLIASPQLSEDDVAALNRAKTIDSNTIKEFISKSLEEVESSITQDRLHALSCLAAEGFLEVKIALRLDDKQRISTGIYHEKIGVFTDQYNNSIAFTGSSNETAGGIINNFESIDVYKSWVDEERVSEKIDNFENLWNDETPNALVINFSEACSDLLKSYRKENVKPNSISTRDIRNKRGKVTPLTLPSSITLRDYQELAISNWFKANGKGVFKMATGSGKTITSLSTAAKLHSKLPLQALIIVCPYRHLVTQWAEECTRFSLTPILAFNARASWEEQLDHELINVSTNSDHFFCLITTNTTYASVFLQSKLKHLPAKTMLIADEVHNMGAKGNWDKLADNIQFRLGLSATPERHNDPDGTKAIFNYFGNIVKPEFTLKDALDSGALTPYRYHPILVTLTNDEAERYAEISEKISRIAKFSQIDKEELSDPLKILLSQRARLIACAENKLPALRDLMHDKTDFKNLLFYCGDGKVEDDTDHNLLRHIEATCKLLGNELGMRVASFVAETTIENREQHKQKLASGDLQGLVAIRCLDEGVDIPSIETAVILASSTNPRQFIQRRGRILRKSPGKSSATIYDMIVIPPDDIVNGVERQLIKRELTRFIEFTDLAMNAGQAKDIILDIQKQYDLLDM